MNMQNKLKFKQLVLEKARERQQEIIDDFRNRIEDMRQTKLKEDYGQFDNEQQSHDNSSHHLIDSFTNELNFTLAEMELLNKMRVGDKTHENVAIGSIVKTDKQTFFPSVSIERFEADGLELFGLSSAAPLFQAMKGKKSGETFSYNNHHYTIEEVF